MARQLDGRDYVLHAWLTFGGTWSVPGTGYCSWVIGAASATGLVYEVPVQGPYTFGPVGGSPTAPSYAQSVDAAVEWAIAWILTHPLQTFGIGGYSMGGEAASRVLAEILTPGGRCYHLRHNFIGGFALGNPSRQEGHGIGPGGVVPDGQGISQFHLTDTPENWVDYCNRFNGVWDFYTRVPMNMAKVAEAAYTLGIELQLNDPIKCAVDLVENLIKLLQVAGVDLPFPNLGAILSGAFIGLLRGLGVKLGAAGDNETAAAIECAILALQFVTSNPPTAPHIRYEFDEVEPGVTYLEHARRHVVTCCHAVPARTAA